MSLARFLAPALVLSVAVVARADEAKTYDFNVKPVYKVGEVTTVATHDESTTEVKVAAADGSPLGTNVDKDVTDFASVHKILEVDAEGLVSKELVHFSAWKHTKGDAESTELTGVHLEVTGRGAKRTWKVLTPGVSLATLADPTKAWLDKKFGASEHDQGEFPDAMKPAKPVAVGDSWEADVTKVAEMIGKDMPIVAAKSSAKATLVAVEGDVATVHIDLKLQVSSFPAGPGVTLKILEGGLFEIAGEGHVPLAATTRGDAGSMTMKLSVKTEGEKGATVTVTVEGAMHTATEAGGEMPEVPAAK